MNLLNSKHKNSHQPVLFSLYKDFQVSSYIPYFKKDLTYDNSVHPSAGLINLSRKLFSVLCSSSKTPKGNRETSALPLYDNLISSTDYSKKTEYYNNLALKSENNYLKSQVSDLEDDVKKLFECNQKMAKLNKNLELKVNFYQKKVHCFTDVYNQIIEYINTIFKKVSNHLLELHNGGTHSVNSEKSPGNKAKEKVRQKLHAIFNQEMMELKVSFKSLQKQIDTLNDEYINVKHLPIAENNASYYLSKILDSISINPTASNSETKSKSNKQNETVLQSSVNQTRKSSKRTEDLAKSPEFSKYDLPLSQRSGNKMQSPRKIAEKKSPSSHGKETVLEISLSPAKEMMEPKPVIKEYATFNRAQRKHIPPTKNNLRNEIHKRLTADKTSNNTRHSSINQISYLSNSALVSQRGSVKGGSNNQSNFASLNAINMGMDYGDGRGSSVNNRGQLSRDSSERSFNNPYIPGQSGRSCQTKPSERLESAPRAGKSVEKQHSSYINTKPDKNNNNNLLFGNTTTRTEKSEFTTLSNEQVSRGYGKEERQQEVNDYRDFVSSSGTIPTGRDSYDNLKSFRKLIQNFRIDLNKVVGQNDGTYQKAGLYKEVSALKSKK